MKWSVEVREKNGWCFVRIGWWTLRQEINSGFGEWMWAKPDSCNSAENEAGSRECKLHPNPVHFNGETCPACEAEREFMALTEDMERKEPDELASVNVGR